MIIQIIEIISKTKEMHMDYFPYCGYFSMLRIPEMLSNTQEHQVITSVDYPKNSEISYF